MANDYTKVNTQEVQNLIDKLDRISNNINSSIQDYQKNLDIIEKAGYLKGVAELAINSSCSRISRLCTEYKEYSIKLSKNLSQVIVKTKEIEQQAKTKIEEIISQDPTTFTGTIKNAFTPNLSNMPATLANALKEVQSKPTGAAVTTGVAAVGTAVSQAVKNAASTITGATTAPSSQTTAIEKNAAVTQNKAPATEVKPTTLEKKASDTVKPTTTAKPSSTTAQTTTAKPATTTTTTTKTTTGKSMDIPSGNTSFKSYTNINALAHNTPQSAVARGNEPVPYGKYKGQVYNTKTDPATGVRYVTFDGSDEKYYCAAMGTYYGEVGDTLNITTDDGNNFNVILTDVKGSDAVSYGNGLSYYHNKGNGRKDIVEFYIERPADDIKVYSGGKYLGTTGNYNDCAAFSGNITSVKKLS